MLDLCLNPSSQEHCKQYSLSSVLGSLFTHDVLERSAVLNGPDLASLCTEWFSGEVFLKI